MKIEALSFGVFILYIFIKLNILRVLKDLEYVKNAGVGWQPERTVRDKR